MEDHDPPKGKRRTLDLVAKVRLRRSVRSAGKRQWLALIHVGIDVYEEHFFDLRPVRFEYLYVGLPALDGVEYVQGDNWLGVALSALMRLPKERQVWLGAEALRRISAAPLGSETRRYRPDFIVLVDEGAGDDDLLRLIVEIKGYRREDAKEKKLTMDAYWVPGVNHLGRFGRWAFAEFTDVYEIEGEFTAMVEREFDKMIDEAVCNCATTGGKMTAARSGTDDGKKM